MNDYGNLIDKVQGFDTLSQMEQVKYVSYFYTLVNQVESFTSGNILAVFEKEKLVRPSNVTDCLNRLSAKTPPPIIKRSNTYYIHRTAKKELDSVYLDKKHVQEISKTLRDLLPKLNSKEQKAFLEEAIVCYEVKAFRAAIIMTWLLTMDIMFEYVMKNKLGDFNTALSKNIGYKGFSITKKEDFSGLKSENDFIVFLKSASIITGDQKKILEEKLGTRNTAAHPNAIEIKESKATNVIEDLVSNIISKFQ